MRPLLFLPKLNPFILGLVVFGTLTYVTFAEETEKTLRAVTAVSKILKELRCSSHPDFITNAKPCTSENKQNTVCLTDGKVQLSIDAINTGNVAVDCASVEWLATDCTTIHFEDCYSMIGAHWYGGTTIRHLEWPVEKWSFRSYPYVTGDSNPDPGEYSGVQERYWFNSNGTAFYVDSEIPLWLGINESNSKQICFKAQFHDSPYRNIDNSQVKLNYTVCQANNVREVHDYISDKYFQRPTTIPDPEMFRHPVWSTWAQYKEAITQERVLEFAHQIISHGFTYSQLEIDDRWERYYGDMEFDNIKFPDPVNMVRDLANLGFRTTIWIHPFVNLNSPSFQQATAIRALVHQTGSTLPALTSWWQGQVSSIIDFTSPVARTWFDNRVRALRQNYNISSFKFDAGETNWLPKGCITLSEVTRNPSIYTTRYAEAAYQLDTDIRHHEVRVGYRTQHLPIFVRMLDKFSVWGTDNGLATLIPHAINHGLIGYPFILPDMVGGNGYGVQPDRELFIRWAQINVFLPSIQFSITPWTFDSEVVDICRRMMDLRLRYVDLMIRVATEQPGTPIIRPLWWIAPQDEVALSIDSEFLVGDDLLVAPVVERGATSRDIYLPAGVWRDEIRGTFYVSSGEWVNNYPAALDQLPYFTRAG